eukprot:TRINITY_DN3963_c4_g4_i2.p1 TRINITY_DN3963_c4_g4~~TRINITY_DN3963_c4_g4_i2.p1  ORF type:complete len:445 (+),score=120.09 TRINITY_DN3963_c4_g4_i2:99-1433(+)
MIEDASVSQDPGVQSVASESKTTLSLGFPWLRTILLVSYGLSCQFLLYSPFLVVFFVQEKHLTEKQVYEDIFPIWTYSYLINVILIGMLTEVVGYRFSLAAGVLGNIATYIILLTTDNYFLLQFEQATVSLASASIIIFSSFVFRAVPRIHYQKVTSAVRSSYLVASVTSSLLGQLLVKLGVSLNALMLITCIICIMGGLLIPFMRALPQPPSENVQLEFKLKIRKKIASIFSELLQTYKISSVLLWSLWMGVAVAIHHLVLTYWQSLLFELSPTSSKNYNGIVSALAYFLAAISALSSSQLEFKLKSVIPVIQVVCPLFSCGLLVAMSFSTSYVIACIGFVAYHISFEFAMPIAQSDVATKMKSERFGIVFSVNTALSILVQVIVQAIIGKGALKLDMRNQFLSFAILLGTLGILTFIWTTYSKIRAKNILYSQVEDQLENPT